MSAWIMETFCVSDNDFKPALTAVARIYPQQQPAKGLFSKEAEQYSSQTLPALSQHRASPFWGSKLNFSRETCKPDKSS